MVMTQGLVCGRHRRLVAATLAVLLELVPVSPGLIWRSMRGADREEVMRGTRGACRARNDTCRHRAAAASAAHLLAVGDEREDLGHRLEKVGGRVLER